VLVRILTLKLHDPATRERVVAELEGMVPRVSAIDALEVRIPATTSLADIVVVLRFASPEALSVYQADPAHRIVSQRTRPACSDYLVTDIEL
jgi:hypothetical protein